MVTVINCLQSSNWQLIVHRNSRRSVLVSLKRELISHFLTKSVVYGFIPVIVMAQPLICSRKWNGMEDHRSNKMEFLQNCEMVHLSPQNGT